MNDDQIAKLKDIFQQVFGDAVPFSTATVANDWPAWDSLKHINLMFEIEKKFGVRFDGAQVARLDSVQKLIEELDLHGAK